jgi:hypothetical protein
MAKKLSKSEPAQRATFIFRGTVLKLKAATVTTIPVTPKTVVVRVDEILRKPNDLFSQFAGSEITVLLDRHETVQKGETAVFYTNSCQVGESLIVQSVGHTAATELPAQAAESAADSRLSANVASANTVVTGTVVSVRVIDADTPGSSAERFQPISEHNPIWQEAIIKVSDIEKGEETPEQIVVRFPESTDVLSYEKPKFRPGQEGVFILHKEGKPKARGRATGRKVAEGEVYTALDAEAFQPLQRIESIRSLIRASGK